MRCLSCKRIIKNDENVFMLESGTVKDIIAGIYPTPDDILKDIQDIVMHGAFCCILHMFEWIRENFADEMQKQIGERTK